MHSDSNRTSHLAGVILAGGAGVRLGQGIKAMAMVAGRPLIAHVIARLAPQVSPLAIGVRAPTDWAREFSLAMIPDRENETGPMAGVATALAWAATLTPRPKAVLTCPTDTPFVPHDLTARLEAALDEDIDIARAASNAQPHYLTALWRLSVLERLTPWLHAGGVAAHRFQSLCRVRDVTWDAAPFDPFMNINTADDLTMAEKLCSSGVGSPS